jgi:hypothetical protein
MATIEIDFEALRAILMPGLEAKIDACEVDADFEKIILLVSGKDVPDCVKARIIFTQTVDDTRQGIVLNAAIKPVDAPWV